MISQSPDRNFFPLVSSIYIRQMNLRWTTSISLNSFVFCKHWEAAENSAPLHPQVFVKLVEPYCNSPLQGINTAFSVGLYCSFY